MNHTSAITAATMRATATRESVFNIALVVQIPFVVHIAFRILLIFYSCMNTRRNTAVRNIAGVKRYRDGRLAINVLSRRQKPRWRMLMLNGDWYDRDRLRAELQAAGFFVPQSRRPLTPNERGAARNLQPWTLGPR